MKKVPKLPDRITLGILADVDAGKTTLTESMLYNTGVIRKPGRVDHGDAFLDNEDEERARGITIFSKYARFSWGGRSFTLIDTPGHTDFDGEAERILPVLDAAVLVISGSKGVNARTRSLFARLRESGAAIFIFVNKTDLPSFDRPRTEAELRGLSPYIATYDGDYPSRFYEDAATAGQEAFDAYMSSGRIGDALLSRALSEGRLLPCIYGSALKNSAVDLLLDLAARLTPRFKAGAETALRVFKTTHDEKGTRLSHVRVTGGTLRVREQLAAGKITQIREYSGSSYLQRDSAEAGSVVVVTGLEACAPGTEITESRILRGTWTRMPAVSCSVIHDPAVDSGEILSGLRILNEELPEMDLRYDAASGEMRIGTAGKLQAELIKAVFRERFGHDIEFADMNVAYLETVRNAVEGVGHYEPLRHYAEVHLMIEPAVRGSGISLGSIVSEDRLDVNRQSAVLSALRGHQLKGVITGAPLTDVRITLVDGRDSIVHTVGGDFREASLRALRQGLMKSLAGEGCVLLEPCEDFEIRVPSEYTGRVIADIDRMRGRVAAQESTDEETVLRGYVPTASSFEYPGQLASLTGGSGSIALSPGSYIECSEQKKVAGACAYDADADTEEPASSVFTDRGAALLVSWDRVEAYMHLPLYSEREARRRTAGPSATRRERKMSVRELEVIFSGISGANKKPGRRRRAARLVRPENAGPASRQKRSRPDHRPELLLIDGYNMIFAWPELKKLAKESIGAARDGLTAMIAGYAGYTGLPVKIIFDAYNTPAPTAGHEEAKGLEIIYTGRNVTADSYIEKYVYENSARERITVATSDRLEQMNVFAAGALRISAFELLERIENSAKEVRLLIDKPGRK